MATTMRAANATDQATIRRMIREADINPMNLEWPNFLVAEDAGAVVGIGQVKTHRDGSRELASIAVVPSRQGQGIGSLIVNSLLERHGDGVLHLTCELRNQGYYERFGFGRISRKEFPRYFTRLIPMVNAFARLGGTEIIVMRR
ncbi:MAG TPA: GNAT family N-acetyltransferase [Candidatus Dormibacteraeota bacterium]|nr:GNAT family N-acetyltransferase [Candidatus Dormibacteraeota bacterium]